jgi:hypothetical protein
VHSLLIILTIGLCAMLVGAETFADMERFGLKKHSSLRERLGLKLPGGIPSLDTFGRLIGPMCLKAFGAAMQTWTQALHHATQGQIAALDGKTVRRSFDTASGKNALHLVNAWASESRFVLAQSAVDTKAMRSKPFPRSWRCLIFAVASSPVMLSTPRKTSRQFVNQGGDYLLPLKENHSLLYEEVRDYFAWRQSQPGGLAHLGESCAQSTSWGHGRHAKRRCFVIAATPEDWSGAREQWHGLQSLMLLESERRVIDVAAPNSAGKISVQQHFYLI